MIRTTMRRAGAALLAVVLVASLGACATSAESDETLLFYKAGPMEATVFSECVKPSARGPWQANNRYIALPTSLRTWNVQPQGGDSNTPVVASSKPTKDAPLGPAVNVWFTMDFYLNYSCEGGKDSPVVQFWEKTGRRFGLSGDNADFNAENWRKMLEATLVQSLIKAIGEATPKYGADQMDVNLQPLGPNGQPIPGSSRTRQLIEADVAASLSAQMREKIQGEYFCGPEYAGGGEVGYNQLRLNGNTAAVEPTPARATCPPLRISITDIAYNDQRLVDARMEVLATEQRNLAAEKAAESKKKVADILAQIGDDPNYMELQRLDAAKYIAEQNRIAAEKCAAAGAQCSVIIGADGGVNVNTR